MNEIFAPQPKPGTPWDVIIVGSGPAALTAAIYTTRGAASTLILGGAAWGGQLMLTTTVDNFPGFPQGIEGPELMQRMKDQAERFGAKFIAQDVHEVDFANKPFKLVANNETYLGRSVIVASGADTLWLGVPGEEKLRGRGVSSCAPCDAPFFKNKKVIVVGGGDAAMEEAMVLTKYASQVLLVHRRDEFRASHAMQDRVKSNPKIEIMWNTEVVEIKGEQKVESVVVKNNKTGEQSELTVDGIFVAIGHNPSSNIFEKALHLDQKGFITVYGHTNTNIEGVFTAGDVHDMHYKQAITAAGFGSMAGLDVVRYLDK